MIGLVLCTACAAVPTSPPRPVEIDTPIAGGPSWQAFTQALPGHWVASVGGHALEVSYRLTARNTVLLETWMPATPAETVSVMHLDGEHLVFTHYCGQGNQPRLRLVERAGGEHVFAGYDVTDLDADESALARLVLGVDGDGRLRRVETYERADEHEITTLVFERVPSAPVTSD